LFNHGKFNSFIEVLEYIKENNTGTDEVLFDIRNYCTGKPEAVKQFIRDVITKNIKIGMDVKSINEAYDKEFIPRFCIQLANNYYEEKEELIETKQPFTLTLKLDGQRCIALKHNGKTVLYSRSGRVIYGCNEIERELNKLRYDDFMIDGEILAQTDETMTSKERYKKTMKIMRTKGDKIGLQFMAFDCITYDEFIKRENCTTYLQRRNNLANILAECNSHSCITYLPNFYCGTDYKVIDVVLKTVIEKNLEGLMLNINSAPYQFDRTSSLLKIKLMQDTELKVLSVKEGKNDNKGRLGAVICSYKGNEVKVGSGFSKYLRDRYWAKPELIIGKNITVQYFEETEDANGKLSLRFPVFKEIREEE